MQNNKTFCILPWVQAVIRNDGSMNPCCQTMSMPFNAKTTSIMKYFNSKELKEIKQKMLNGEKIDMCVECYDAEKNVGTSLRTEANQDYKFYYDKYYHEALDYFGYNNLDYPIKLELHVGNACNLKCLTCNPRDSSAFLTEDRILKISNYDQKDFNINHSMIENVKEQLESKKIKILDLRGGESMLEPKIRKFLTSLDDKITRQIELRIQTNATILDDQWREIITKFKSVDLMLSIDAYGDDNHYIRFPSNWDTIVNNVKEFKTMKTITNLYVNTTVSNLNFLLLPNLFDWLIEEKITSHLHTLNTPSIFQVTNFPKKLFNNAILEIKGYIGKFDSDRTNLQLKNLISYVERNINIDNTQDWKDFCILINKRDKHRQNSIFDILPKLKEYWIDA